MVFGVFMMMFVFVIGVGVLVFGLRDVLVVVKFLGRFMGCVVVYVGGVVCVIECVMNEWEL